MAPCNSRIEGFLPSDGPHPSLIGSRCTITVKMNVALNGPPTSPDRQIQPFRPTAHQVHLRILATSDLHMHVFPYDYHLDHACNDRGLALTAGLITAARAEAANTLLVDNGDFLQGNPLGDYVAERRGLTGALHPMIAAMNRLGYDAATLGNHEFSHGLDFLITALDGARFPVVSANILRVPGDGHLLPPFALLDRRVQAADGTHHMLRVGVIGFAPPQTVMWESRTLAGRIVAQDILASAAALVPALRRAGADLVIALSHSGIGQDAATAGMENASAHLAALPGIDVVITGHAHLVFPSAMFAASNTVDPVAGTLCGKPAVMPGFNGSHLGVIDLALDREDTGWRVARHRVQVRPVAERQDDGSVRAVTTARRDVLDAVAVDHDATLVWTRRPVGYSAVPLHSYFALVTPTPAVRLVAAAQAAHVARALLGRAEAALPLLSAAAPFKAGGRGGPANFTNVPAGDLALRHAADLYIHPNTIVALRVTGAEVLDWLERAAGLFYQIPQGAQDAALIDPDFPSFNFDLIDGLDFRIDLAQPARFDRYGALADPGAHRIVGLSHRGKPVAPDAAFVLATNSYRSGGSGQFAGTGPDRVILSDPDLTRDVVLQHIERSRSTMPAPAPSSWGFVPMPGTSVTFDTAPAAIDHLDELSNLDLEPLSQGTSGFLRFRLRL